MKRGANAQSPSPQPGRFSGKVALVTGASERGIGGAIAERLAREGARLALVSRNEPKRLLDRLARMGAEALWRPCDVSRQKQVDEAFAVWDHEFDKIDVVVNNAGIEVSQSFESLSDKDWDEIVAINLTGAMRVTRAALARMPASGGAIVNIASALALGGCSQFAAYSAAKAGMIGMTQALAAELAPRGIRAVAIAPAMVITPMTFKHIARLKSTARDAIDSANPLGPGSPHDVAAAVAFLASDEARWITGVTLPMGWAPTYWLPMALYSAEESIVRDPPHPAPRAPARTRSRKLANKVSRR